MTDDIIIVLLAVLCLFFAWGWWSTARMAKTMAQVNMAQIKGMHYTLTGEELGGDEGDEPR